MTFQAGKLLGKGTGQASVDLAGLLDFATQTSVLGEGLSLTLEAGCYFTGRVTKAQKGQLALPVPGPAAATVMCSRGRQLHRALQLPGLSCGGGACHHSDC